MTVVSAGTVFGNELNPQPCFGGHQAQKKPESELEVRAFI